MTTKVKGLDRLLRQLAAVPVQVQAVMAQELATDAAAMADHIKAAAPRGRGGDHSGHYQGHMADNIRAETVTTTRHKGEASVMGAAGLAWKVSAPFPARFVEFGTKAAPAGRYQDAKGKTRTNKRGHHATTRQPFFWPTIRAFRKPLHAKMVRAGSKAAKAAAGL